MASDLVHRVAARYLGSSSLLARVVARYLLAKGITYTGVFLTEPSHHALLQWWASHTKLPLLGGKTFAHHMTIKFKPSAADVAQLTLGTKVKLHVVGWAADEKGQAVLVEPVGVKSDNKHAHITISTASGVGPVYSNELLGKGVTHANGPTLEGVIDARE
jgi:hypothetical protein